MLCLEVMQLREICVLEGNPKGKAPHLQAVWVTVGWWDPAYSALLGLTLQMEPEKVTEQNGIEGKILLRCFAINVFGPSLKMSFLITCSYIKMSPQLLSFLHN